MENKGHSYTILVLDICSFTGYICPTANLLSWQDLKIRIPIADRRPPESISNLQNRPAVSQLQQTKYYRDTTLTQSLSQTAVFLVV